MSLIDMPNGVTMQWLMDDKVDERAAVSLAKMTVAIGVTSEKHHHTNWTETIHVLDGQIEQSIGPKIQTLSAGETCLIPMGISHQTRNIGDKPAIMMIAYSSGTRDYLKSD